VRKLTKLERRIKRVMILKDNNNYRKMHGLPLHRKVIIKGKRYKMWHYGVIG
jgi:hypothetical protein